MLSVRVNAIKGHSVSPDGAETTVELDAKHVGELSLLMTAERCEQLFSALSSVRSQLQAKGPGNPDQVRVRVPKNWLVSADLQVHEVVVLVLNHRTSDQIGYALDAAAAKQMAEALAKNAEVVLKHKALKQK